NDGLPAPAFGLLEGVLCHAPARGPRDLAYGDEDIVRDLYFLADVQTLGAFPHADEIHLAQRGGGAFIRFYGADVRVKVELLPDGNRNALRRARASGRGRRSLEAGVRLGKCFPGLFRYERIPAVLFPPLGARIASDKLELSARRFYRFHHQIG